MAHGNSQRQELILFQQRKPNFRWSDQQIPNHIYTPTVCLPAINVTEYNCISV